MDSPPLYHTTLLFEGLGTSAYLVRGGGGGGNTQEKQKPSLAEKAVEVAGLSMSGSNTT